MAKSSSREINLQQPSYRRLRAVLKERTRPVVLWCGAGLSEPAGLPSWAELRAALLSDLENKAHSFEEPERSRLLASAVAIEQESDAWIAFTRLKDVLGDASFKEGVREHLALRETSIPFQYSGFWSSGIRGVVNLNLDRLATQAYASIHKASIVEVNSKNIQSAPQAIGSGRAFVLNLHGVLEDVDTWIFTHEALKELKAKAAYKTALSALFTNFAVLFAGISADDVAASGFLANLTALEVDLSGHFWLTSRNDSQTDRWAESVGIQAIRYSSRKGHEAVYKEMFDDLATFIPQDDEIPPAIRSDLVDAQKQISSPSELAKNPPEDIRRQLTAYARHILETSKSPVPDDYRAFISNYARSIYNSWYVSSAEPDNLFFGYRIKQELGEGSFSKVYKATSEEGSECAIKLMHESLSRDEIMLSSFRRGINSMRILENHQMPGMVRLIDAVELPAAIIMEFVDGPTLEQAVESSNVDPWEDGLEALIRVTEIVRDGHHLPERVLHRDIRPSNIMLRNFYNPDVSTEIVVLDFDLSWHRGAFDFTMKQHAQAALGYLAPEQIHESKVTTRSAAVDTHGLCAMMYFVFSGEHPPQGLFQRADFDDELKSKVKFKPNRGAASVGNRIRRMIKAGVSWSQTDRPDFGEIYRELRLIKLALTNIQDIASTDFWAEEILCRVRGEGGYEYYLEQDEYVSRLVGGMEVRVKPDVANRSLSLQISFSAQGTEDRRNIVKYLKKRLPETVQMLKNSGWKMDKWSEAFWSSSYSIRGSISVNEIRNNSEKIVSEMSGAISRLSFDQ